MSQFLSALMRSRLPFFAAAVLFGALPARSDVPLGLYGGPGLIDMPTAETLGDGQVALGFARLPESQRFSAGFQVLPRVNLTFRYSGIGDLGGATASSGYSLWDRSLDLSLLLLREGDYLPAVSLGIRDVLGTGVLSSEYLVATKEVVPGLSVTAGLGWGRLATGNSIGALGSRPEGTGGSFGGELRLESLFRGDVGLFGGLRWQTPVEGLSLAVEYSSDNYAAEERFGVTRSDTPWNIGVAWQPRPDLTLGLATMGGQGIAFNVAAVLDPRGPDLFPKATWTLPDTAVGGAARFDGSGVTPLSLGRVADGCTATVAASDVRSAAVAVDRAGRALAADGCAEARVRVARAGLMLSETRLDLSGGDPVVLASGAAAPGLAGDAAIPAPAFDWSLAPMVRLSLFDPDRPLYHDLSLALQASYRFAPGLSLSGQVSRTVTGDFDRMRRGPKGSLPRVRTEAVSYLREEGLRLDYLTLDRYGQLSEHVFTRLSAGYLETMYAGASAEIYMRHDSLPLAFSAEVNYVAARDFDQGLGLRDLPGLAALNGHASVYWDTGFQGIELQLDAGRYLAGDLGATLSVSRDFRNGWEIGAYATLTDASAAEFGEGSYDKGIFFRAPLAAFWPRETGLATEARISSLTGDGGQRVMPRNRLHEIVSRGDARTVLAGCRPGVPCFSR